MIVDGYSCDDKDSKISFNTMEKSRRCYYEKQFIK